MLSSRCPLTLPIAPKVSDPALLRTPAAVRVPLSRSQPRPQQHSSSNSETTEKPPYRSSSWPRVSPRYLCPGDPTARPRPPPAARPRPRPPRPPRRRNTAATTTAAAAAKERPVNRRRLLSARPFRRKSCGSCWPLTKRNRRREARRRQMILMMDATRGEAARCRQSNQRQHQQRLREQAKPLRAKVKADAEEGAC